MRKTLRRTAAAIFAAAVSAPPPASATPSGVTRLDADFVALLGHRGSRRHPLADASGRLPLVVEVPRDADPRALGLLPLAPGLATVRVAPSALPNFVAAYPGAHFSIWPALHPTLDVATRRGGFTAYRAALAARGGPVAGTGKGVVVGIVDTGVDASHPDLRDAAGRTRIAWLLDFSLPPSGLHADLENTFGCTSPDQSSCAVFAQADIDRSLAGEPGAALTADVVGHGTHVASIAAGSGGSDTRFAGSAPEATLIIASVARGASTSGLADVDIVTATRFIFDRAEQMGLPAVVNLSLGGDFGPHDGTTPIETALAALVGPSHPGRAIVVAAGNSGALYRGDEEGQVLGIHTETRVTEGVPAQLKVLTPDARKGSTLFGTTYLWLTYRANDAVAVGLRGPGGLSIPPLRVGEKGGFRSSDDKLTAAIYNGAFAGQSPLAPTSHGAVVIWDGQWPGDSAFTLELEGEGFAEAWVEAEFLEAATAGAVFFDLATRAGTINVPASHPDLIAVGCVNNRATWTDRAGVARDLAATAYTALASEDGSCYFSSAGPTVTGAMKPDISAPGAMVAAAMSTASLPESSPSSAFVAPSGLCADGSECLVLDAGHALLSGSSMSAPQVAGAVALLFERDARLTQPEVLRLLQAGARRPTGAITADYQLGVGALDVVGTMAGLAARATPIVREPDAAASWLSLANSYVHPGTGEELVGTVAVRAADGAIADGFGGQRLTLEVGQGGVVKAPLARVAAGLYRFAVGAQEGTGSRVVSLDVKIDGVPVGAPGSRVSGHRLLPVGADRWIAAGSARVYGGCSVGAWVGTASNGAQLGAVFFLALVNRTCRRRTPRGSRPLH